MIILALENFCHFETHGVRKKKKKIPSQLNCEIESLLEKRAGGTYPIRNQEKGKNEKKK